MEKTKVDYDWRKFNMVLKSADDKRLEAVVAAIFKETGTRPTAVGVLRAGLRLMAEKYNVNEKVNRQAS